MNTINSFAKLGAAFGLKTRECKPERKVELQEKFLKCFVCGKQMTYVQSTNILTCENEVTRKDGKIDICGNRKLFDADTLNYANYIFG